jgi:hypothetical protein
MSDYYGYGQDAPFQYYRLPDPLNCKDNNDGQKDPTTTTTVTLKENDYPNFCTWNKTLEGCLKILQPLKGTSSWVFLGSSDMALVVEYVSMKWPPSALYQDPTAAPANGLVNTTSRRNSCQNLLYYALPPPKEWKAPDVSSKGEGPVGFGLQNPYCNDCRTCWNIRMDAPPVTIDSTADPQSTSTTRPKRQYIEYLVVEYTRDVSIPTLVTNTTQETVAYYLKSQLPEVCVVSVGLLDAMIHPPVSQSTFIHNMDRYIGLLQRVCRNVVWISIPVIVEDPTVIPQTRNCQLLQWNNAVVAKLQERNYKNVYVLDVWEKTLESDHSTYLKLHKKFYATLARLFVTIMFDVQ